MGETWADVEGGKEEGGRGVGVGGVVVKLRSVSSRENCSSSKELTRSEMGVEGRLSFSSWSWMILASAAEPEGFGVDAGAFVEGVE